MTDGRRDIQPAVPFFGTDRAIIFVGNIIGYAIMQPAVVKLLAFKRTVGNDPDAVRQRYGLQFQAIRECISFNYFQIIGHLYLFQRFTPAEEGFWNDFQMGGQLDRAQ